MFANSTSCGAVLLLTASAFAQSNARSMLRPVTSTVRDAGVYHAGIGTWTRHVDTVNGITHDIIYSNTCPVGYYAGQLTNEYFVDEGRIPGPNGYVVCDPSRLSVNKGCACSYDVSGFQIGYCSGLSGTLPVHVNIGFEQAYTACAVPTHIPGSPSTFDLLGLPGANSMIQGCWLVTVDLEAASLTMTNFAADGASCTWAQTDLPTNHLFGWTFQNLSTVTGTGTSYVGPLIAWWGGQAPTPTCSMVDNTRWDTLTCSPQGGGPAKWPNNTTEDGWGMDTQDRFRDDTTSATGGPLSPPSGPGCYFFGSNPGGSFHMKLFANTGCREPSAGVDICRPIEDGLTCPCHNQPTTAGAGCNGLSPGNVATGGARMTSIGNAVPYDQPSGEAPSPAPHVVIDVHGLPTAATESALLIQGTMTIAPLQFGQGLRCCGGPLKRMTPPHVAPGTGTSFWPNFGGGAPDFFATISERSNNLPGAPVHIVPGQTYCYFIEYRQSLFFPPCTLPANFNTSQGQTIAWHL
jgi:hypothetical protein